MINIHCQLYASTARTGGKTPHLPIKPMYHIDAKAPTKRVHRLLWPGWTLTSSRAPEPLESPGNGPSVNFRLSR
jgi:hypothetical protein